jgi:hypothetical protein
VASFLWALAPAHVRSHFKASESWRVGRAPRKAARWLEGRLRRLKGIVARDQERNWDPLETERARLPSEGGKDDVKASRSERKGGPAVITLQRVKGARICQVAISLAVLPGS